MLATEYYQAHPERVSNLILGSATLDAKAWERQTRDLLQTLPDSMVQAVETREAERNYTAPDYQAAMEESYARYVWCRQITADLDSMMATFNASMHEYMWGAERIHGHGHAQGVRRQAHAGYDHGPGALHRTSSTSRRPMTGMPEARAGLTRAPATAAVTDSSAD